MTETMHKVFVVRWNKVKGKYTQWELFTSREIAVRFLNRQVLDLGNTDARLKTDKVMDEFYRDYFMA